MLSVGLQWLEREVGEHFQNDFHADFVRRGAIFKQDRTASARDSLEYENQSGPTYVGGWGSWRIN